MANSFLILLNVASHLKEFDDIALYNGNTSKIQLCFIIELNATDAREDIRYTDFPPG